MTFERIKTVKGHQYKYEVESVRENGKIRQKIVNYHGRVDKEPVATNSFAVPYGFYYFSQDGCSACDSKEEVIKELKLFCELARCEAPEVHYVNVTHDPTPFNLYIRGTPTVLESSKGGVFLTTGMDWRGWLFWRFGSTKAEEVLELYSRELKLRRMNDIRELIKQGLKFKKIRSYGHNEDEIKECLTENEREKLKCKGGSCPLPA